MATIRPAGERGDDVEIMLTDVNPYGSRTLVVERDETSSVAYLCGSGGMVHGAAWLANHGPAPAEIDLERTDSGLPPVVPRANTRHPDGRPRWARCDRCGSRRATASPCTRTTSYSRSFLAGRT
ncbi:hypothetical protein ACFQX6_29890 [Streptosporangium lutulentum]